MNYYTTNLYQDYPYGNAMTSQYGNNMQYNNAPQFATQNVLNGKIVDSADMVKATEVPIGSYGVFPKADLSEMDIKTWNNNGTTNIITFQPVKPIKLTEPEININTLFDKINILENKIDSLVQKDAALIQKQPPIQNEQSSKKEIKANDY